MTKTEAQNRIYYLLSHPDELLLKRPFTRGSDTFSPEENNDGNNVQTMESVTAELPQARKRIVTQSRFAKELDPLSHEVCFDANIPSICVKLDDGGFQELKFKRMPLAFQERIRQKQTLTMCGNPCELTLRLREPSEKDLKYLALIRTKWCDRNQDGMRTKAVYTQKGYGDVGLLYYFDRNGHIKSRLLSYEDGYIIISHNDDNGDRLLECVYYCDKDGCRCLDCYDDTYLYRLRQNTGSDTDTGWKIASQERHGFPEIPLVTKRGDVAWNAVQSLIEAYETLYNVFIVIQKRHGWGILYIKGKFDESVKRLAGSIILNDRSLDNSGSAEFKAPPTPTGYLETMQTLYEQIQIHSSTTFILPKDVKTGGDISAIAIMLTQELDLEGGTQGIIEWQNFADKMLRLFKYGLSVELVKSGDPEYKNAITEIEGLDMSCKFKLWRPFNETEYNQMLCTLRGAGLISKKTAIERNTIAQPDEELRINREAEEAAEAFQKQQEAISPEQQQNDDTADETQQIEEDTQQTD